MRGHAAAAALRPALLPCRLSRPRRLSRLFAASSCLEPPLNAADVWWLPLTYDMASAVAGREREQQHPQQVHRSVSNAFLRHVLSQYTNQAPEALRLVRTEHGKPFLPGGLVNFNMSHADGLVGGTLHSLSSLRDMLTRKFSAFTSVLSQSPFPVAMWALISSCESVACGDPATN